MDSLASKIKRLGRKNASNSYFIPEVAFFQIMTDEQVQRAIAESGIRPYHRDEVIDQVCRRGRKILGILILANCVSLVQHFIEAVQLEDAKLPFTEAILTESVLLSDEQATDFDKEQWLFTAPAFQRGTINRRLVKGSVLPFKVDKPIGAGGFSTVYEVILDPDHQVLDGVFPRKFVRNEFFKVHSHQQELQNFAILNSLKHPNIVELLSSYTYDDVRHNLLFPLVEHGSLREFMSKDRKSTQYISDDSVITALAGLSSAVKHLHDFKEKNLDLDLIGCHHDLKPENILVSDTTFILADFGLSKLKPSHEDSNTPFRSRMDDYVAPECEDWDNDYQAGSIRRTSDIWSFGCIIAEVVTYVFRGSNGPKNFREARRFKRLGATHFAFHQGPKQSSDAVADWLSGLETSCLRSFALVIQLVRRLLALSPSGRPKAKEVESFLRFVALFQATARIDDQFQQFVENDPRKLDTFHEHLRLTAWRYALGMLNVQDAADVQLQLNHNILDQFDKIIEVLTRLGRDLDARLSPDETTTPLDISQLSKLSDELGLFLNERQDELSQECFKISISDDDNLAEAIQNQDKGIPLSHEIRMRTNIKHMAGLLEQASRPRSRALQIGSDQVHSLNPFGQHHVGRRKDDKGSRPVWVEWRKYGDHGTDETTMSQLYDRTAGLAEMFSREQPEAFRTLRCSGFVHKPEREAFEVIFEFPEVPVAVIPLDVVHLSQVIAKTQSGFDLPDLDDRFKLASTLAAALSEFHSVGWLHKSLTAENIIFFNTEGAPITQLNLVPWLVGFNDSKPDDPSGLRSGLSDSTSKLYHHSIYMENKHDCRREFDYYSLGIVLLEIGYWEPFDEMTRKWTGFSEAGCQKLLKDRVPGLSKTMGRGYSEAVRFCIECATDETASRRNPKDALLHFIQRVVTPLGSFLC